jgi:nucleoid-associated protein YgaU
MLSGSTIGIKIADGSYYPVLDEDFTGKKKLTLTTVKDNQNKVQIDLYRGDGEALDQSQYIGSLIIENIPPLPHGEPDIELLLGLDAEGELTAEASDLATGESQSFSISLKTLAADETYEIPEFEMESSAPKAPPPEEPPLTGESYPVGEEDRRKSAIEHRRTSPWLIVLFVVIGLALIAAVSFLIYQSVKGSPASAPKAATTAPTQTTPAAPAEQTTAAPAAGESTTGVAAAPQPAETEAVQPKGAVTYRIKKGDTLWDISSTYYRNPWLYPKLAKANNIKNPDLIFAGSKITIPEE